MTGIYIHIPFCERKCFYCDFNSYASHYDQEEAYMNVLCDQILHYKGTKTDTVYIGGGTPSTLSEDHLRKILLVCHDSFSLTEDAEITVEVNPASSIKRKLRTLKNCGVNRLSIGIQSFSPNELEALGRLHDRDEAIRTVKEARDVGFLNLNIDLMLAIPYQTKESLINTLTEAVTLNPDHISAYSLILEPGTLFFDGVHHLPTEDEEREFYWFTVDFLKANGYEQYEISNFSKKGKESQHNRKYWSGEDYIGIGAGAHSFLNGIRYSHHASIRDYINNPFAKENVEVISAKERQKEFFLLGFRKKEGVPYQGEFPEEINRLKRLNLIEEKDGFVRLTRKGTDFANQVFMEFV